MEEWPSAILRPDILSHFPARCRTAHTINAGIASQPYALAIPVQQVEKYVHRAILNYHSLTEGEPNRDELLGFPQNRSWGGGIYHAEMEFPAILLCCRSLDNHHHSAADDQERFLLDQEMGNTFEKKLPRDSDHAVGTKNQQPQKRKEFSSNLEQQRQAERTNACRLSSVRLSFNSQCGLCSRRLCLPIELLGGEISCPNCGSKMIASGST